MKKTYLQPKMVVHTVCTTNIIALSGNFQQGKTIDVGIKDEEIDGGDAWVKPFVETEEFWDD
jgi:hypothetical protein